MTCTVRVAAPKLAALWITSNGLGEQWHRAAMDEIERPIIPGYDAVTRLGSGASGEVWAVRRSDGIRLAAKVIRPDLRLVASEEDFLRQIDHDHVIKLRDVVVADDGRKALILDLAEGGSLADSLVSRVTLTPGELVTVLTPISRCLHDLHGSGLVHADLSTDNILFTDAGKPMLSDLGVSRLAGSYDEHTWATESWAAPEVLTGENAGPESDVYSLGAIAWACVTGAPPPPSVQRPELATIAPQVPPRLVDLIDRAMSFDRHSRPSAGEFALRLWECAPAEPAPIAGSRGARRTANEGEPAELTRRMIRAAKEGADASSDDREASRAVRLRTWLTDRRGAILPGVGAATVTGLLATGSWMLLPGLSADAVGVLADTPSWQASRSSAQRPTVAAPGRGQAGKPNTTASAAPKKAAAQAIQTPSQIIQRLVTARARAWSQEDPQLLGPALAPGSPARAADERSLIEARRQGIDYRDVRFKVGQVSVTVNSKQRMVAVVAVSRPAYTVETSGAVQTMSATSERVQLTLTRTAEGEWRIHSWG